MMTAISEEIKSIISLLEQADKDNKWHQEQTVIMDRETQDILHSLELDKLTRSEIGKLTTRLRKVRRERREHKVIAENTAPLAEFLRSDKGRHMCNLLKEALGQTRKIETYHKYGKYKPRVRKEAEDGR